MGPELAWTREVEKYERVTDTMKSTVVEAKVKDAKKIRQVAGRIEAMGPFGKFRLYNVDLPPNQSYLYEHDIFPLAYCEVNQARGRLEWDLLDEAKACDYALPDLTALRIDVGVAKQGKIPRFTDRIGEIVAFVLGGISAVFAYRLTRSPFKYFSPLLGAIALVSLVFSASGHDLGLGVGGMERMVVYPIVIWLIMLGGYLMATDSAKLTPA